MKLLTALLFICLLSVSAVGATRYARNDGGTTTQCTGLANAPYDGSGTGEACAYSNFQDLLNAVQCGDTGIPVAGHHFATVEGAGSPFIMPDKTTGCVGTIADLITIQSSAVASLPAGRVSMSNKTDMFKLSASDAAGVLTAAQGAAWWKFDGMEITNTGPAFANVLVTVAGPQGGSLPAETFGDHITFDRCYIHPQEDGTSDYMRTANVGISWNAGDVTVTRSRISGFVGIYGHTQQFRAFTVNTTTNELTVSGAGVLPSYVRVIVFSTSALPAPLSTDPTFYWCVSTGTDTFQLANTQSGTPIDITSAGSGTLTVNFPEPINTGAFWTNFGGPYLIDDNYLSANYNPLFLGAGENGSGHVATIQSGATETGATLSPTTDLPAIGDFIALESHGPPWAPTIGFYQDAAGDHTTDTFTMVAHGLENGDNILFTRPGFQYYDAWPTPVDPLTSLPAFPQRYYVINKTADTFQASATRGGSAVNFSSSGTVSVTLGGHLWINALVTGVNTGTGAITYTTFVRFEGFFRADIIAPYEYTPSHAFPMAGGLAKWNGNQVHDFDLTHNTVDLDEASAQYVYDRTGSKPKAFAEIKNMDGGTWEGNIFEGWPSTIAFTLANQNATSPWVKIRNVMIRSNLFKAFSVVGFAQLMSGTMAENGENLTFENNLAIGAATSTGGNGGHNGPAWFISGTAGGKGTPLILRHNTVINKQDIDGGYAITISGAAQPLEGSGGNIWRDNIFFWNRNGVQGDMATQFPNLSEDQNLLVDHETFTVGSSVMLSKLPNSIYVADHTAVMWTNYANCLAGILSGCVLQAGSPGKNQGTDNMDIGVNIAVLEAALAGGGGNGAPTVDAGSNQTLGVGTTSFTLTATADDPEDDTLTYLWTRISGPNTPTIVSPTSLSTNVTGAIGGIYVYRMTATDTSSNIGTDDVQITILTVVPPIICRWSTSPPCIQQ